MDIRDAAALVGAITGPLGLFVASLVYFRDRPIVKISLNWDMEIFGDGIEREKQFCIVIRNVGRRPIYLSHVQIKIPRGNKKVSAFVMNDSLHGVTLTEGSSPHQILKPQSIIIRDDVKSIWWKIRAAVETGSATYYSDWPIKAPSWAENITPPYGVLTLNKFRNWIRRRLPWFSPLTDKLPERIADHMKLNWKGGFFRLWVVGATTWYLVGISGFFIHFMSDWKSFREHLIYQEINAIHEKFDVGLFDDLIPNSKGVPSPPSGFVLDKRPMQKQNLKPVTDPALIAVLNAKDINQYSNEELLVVAGITNLCQVLQNRGENKKAQECLVLQKNFRDQNYKEFFSKKMKEIFSLDNVIFIVFPFIIFLLSLIVLKVMRYIITGFKAG